MTWVHDLPLAHVVRPEGVTDFLSLGVRHILSGPDHILFVLSLLLAAPALAELARLTLTFTAAHSITLLLAGFGVLTLPSSVVEPMIAFSIAFMALTTVFLKDMRIAASAAMKMSVVFFFGLFHGLGFAGLLNEVEIPEGQFVPSLLLFNVGIEIGQLCIVGLGLLVVNAVRETRAYRGLIIASAVAIALAGVLFGIERVVNGV